MLRLEEMSRVEEIQEAGREDSRDSNYLVSRLESMVGVSGKLQLFGCLIEDDNLKFFESAKQFRALLREPHCKGIRRNDLSRFLLSHCKEAIETTFQYRPDMTAEIFRCLRDLCAKNKSQQELLRTDAGDELIQSFINTISSLEWGYDTIEESKIVSVRSGLQFLGNLLVNNECNKFMVWKRIYPVLRWLLTQTKDNVIRRYTCMIIYNCLINVSLTPNVMLNKALDPVFPTLINFLMTEDNEWGLQLIELMLQQKNFVASLLNELTNKQMCFFLDVVENVIQQENTSATTAEKHSITLDNLDFIKEQFVSCVDKVLKSCQSFNGDAEEPMIVAKLLRVLGCAAALDNYRPHLQADSALLIIVTYFLKGIHMTVNSGIMTDKSDANDPMHGMKCDLVRLLGNLCWTCKENQDKVREMDGIAVLLECCKIDEQNPFIMQWAIFAIHNLCEKNPENQAYIASVQSINSSDSVVRETNNNDVSTTANTSNTTSNNEMIDCEELMESMQIQEIPKTSHGVADLTDINDLFF